MYIQYIDNFLNMTALCNQTKSNRKLFLQLPTKFSLHLLRVFFVILHYSAPFVIPDLHTSEYFNPWPLEPEVGITWLGGPWIEITALNISDKLCQI